MNYAKYLNLEDIVKFINSTDLVQFKSSKTPFIRKGKSQIIVFGDVVVKKVEKNEKGESLYVFKDASLMCVITDYECVLTIGANPSVNIKNKYVQFVWAHLPNELKVQYVKDYYARQFEKGAIEQTT